MEHGHDEDLVTSNRQASAIPQAILTRQRAIPDASPSEAIALANEVAELAVKAIVEQRRAIMTRDRGIGARSEALLAIEALAKHAAGAYEAVGHRYGSGTPEHEALELAKAYWEMRAAGAAIERGITDSRAVVEMAAQPEGRTIPPLGELRPARAAGKEEPAAGPSVSQTLQRTAAAPGAERGTAEPRTSEFTFEALEAAGRRPARSRTTEESVRAGGIVEARRQIARASEAAAAGIDRDLEERRVDRRPPDDRAAHPVRAADDATEGFRRLQRLLGQKPSAENGGAPTSGTSTTAPADVDN